MTPWRVPFPKFGDGPGLDRVSAVAARLGVDLAAFGAGGAVVVGSNGKGSTAAMCAALLRQASGSVGLFTSPHLFALNERFNIDGSDIDDGDLARHWERVLAAIEVEGLGRSIGGFEFLFLVAADWFAARRCAHTVWEAGIGGRLDPVRLLQARRVALTSLDLEHTQLLGDTLEQIAREKLDAAPAGARVFVGASCLPQREVIETHALARGVTPMWPAPAPSAPMPGVFQRDNAALALALAQDVAAITEAQARAGFAAARWPARLETLTRDPLVVVDAGHTPRAIAAALEGFETLRDGRRALLVCGASADKDVRAIVSALAPSFRTIICAAARHKGAPPAEIAAHANAANPDAELTLAESVADARRLALAKANAAGAVYVAGGLFLAAEFRALHLGRDPARLVFF